MPIRSLHARQLYDEFRKHLSSHDCQFGPLHAMATLLPKLNASTAAVIASRVHNGKLTYELRSTLGSAGFWKTYIDLCHSNREPLSRTLRLSPHPLALSDLRKRPALEIRSFRIIQLLKEHGMDNLFAIPVLNNSKASFLVTLAGRALHLGPTNRHLSAQAAIHLVAQATPIANQNCQYLSLTSRQMEVAEWLMAGKTDWEIGEILRISPKTVNYHVEKMKRTYGVRSRAQFIAAIVYEGGLTPTPIPNPTLT